MDSNSERIAERAKSPLMDMCHGNPSVEGGPFERSSGDACTEVVTIMETLFTDVCGKNSFNAEMFQKNEDLITPIIMHNGGALLKTLPDRTVFYFTVAENAVRAAAKIQQVIDEQNLESAASGRSLIRIGLHTGVRVVGQKELEGKMAAVASHCVSIAHGGEIVLTGETRNSLPESDEFSFKFLKAVTSQGSGDYSFNTHKMVWKPTEIEIDISITPVSETGDANGAIPPIFRAMMIGLPVIAVFYLFFNMAEKTKFFSSADKRVTLYRATPPTEQGRYLLEKPGKYRYAETAAKVD